LAEQIEEIEAEALAEASEEIEEVEPQEEAQEQTQTAQEEPKPEITIALDEEKRKALNHILDVMTEIGVSEATFRYDGGLSVKQMDDSRVAMVVASIALGQQELGEPVKRSFTVNLKALRQALKLHEPIIYVRDADMVVKGGVGYTGKEAEVSLPLLETLDEDIPEPNLNFDIEATIDFDDIRKAFNILVKKPEAVAFEANGGELTVKAVNDEMQRISLNGFKSSGEGKAIYGWSYLKALKKTWSIQFSKDSPLKASRKETSGEQKIADITVYIAPRIEVE